MSIKRASRQTGQVFRLWFRFNQGEDLLGSHAPGGVDPEDPPRLLGSPVSPLPPLPPLQRKLNPALKMSDIARFCRFIRRHSPVECDTSQL